MRRIVVSEFISLDGVVEGPGGAEGSRHGGWTFKFEDPAGMKYKLDEVSDHEAMLQALDSGTVILTYHRP